jgi:hypothetical protein
MKSLEQYDAWARYHVLRKKKLPRRVVNELNDVELSSEFRKSWWQYPYLTAAIRRVKYDL